MFRTRRGFLRSLSATALVLSFEDVLSLALPPQQAQPGTMVPAQQNSRPEYNAPSRPAPKVLPSPVAGTLLGVSFLDVAKHSGLNARTVYGGEHKNKYLLETTGCGVSFYDYDNDDWIDIFLVNG
ncbi:MAG: CRTAC1 family protein, partial [Silvibacterium sp.]